MPIVYVLLSDKTGRHYTGSSRDDNVDGRLKRHNTGLVQSTKHGRPWRVVLTQMYDTYREARKQELFLKSGVGREKLREFFNDPKHGEVPERLKGAVC
ncbi:GIY-YIG nuclease family protein [Candidatus Uhrbacteria bacterium]|nr:GIY-YIG nuclease family protein [Candidatus Uhrbacteria bacterium]